MAQHNQVIYICVFEQENIFALFYSPDSLHISSIYFHHFIHLQRFRPKHRVKTYQISVFYSKPV